MKLLWLCNTQPGVVRSAIAGKPMGAVNWVDHVLSDLRGQGEKLLVLCPGDGRSGAVDESLAYATFQEGLPYIYLESLERLFAEQIRAFSPDVIHIWGLEYGHALAMVNAAEALGMLEHTVASIQGLCGVYASHYAEGLPEAAGKRFTLRDFLRQDNIRQQQKKFARRGELEAKALEKLRHVIGRTDWDYACTKGIYPALTYHFCNETLREPFYQGQWQYASCRYHRIFASSRMYPLKGFHYVLEAAAQLRRFYPDLTVAVTGESYLGGGISNAIRREGYAQYLKEQTQKLHLEDCVEFLGRLSAEGMKKAYLEANVFVLPSSIENSPNVLGEAMLLGAPCVASVVGGVQNLMTHGEEGFLYPSTAPYMLSHYIHQVFEMGAAAEAMGRRASVHARRTHDPAVNLEVLLEIYHGLL